MPYKDNEERFQRSRLQEFRIKVKKNKGVERIETVDMSFLQSFQIKAG